MVLNATFNNISAILWRTALMVEEIGQNHWPVTSYWQTLSHNVVSSTHRLSRIRTHNIVRSDGTGHEIWLRISCKDNAILSLTVKKHTLAAPDERKVGKSGRLWPGARQIFQYHPFPSFSLWQSKHQVRVVVCSPVKGKFSNLIHYLPFFPVAIKTSVLLFIYKHLLFISLLRLWIELK